MIRRIIGHNATHIIVGVFIQQTPRRLEAIVNGVLVTTEETDSGVVFSHHEYQLRSEEPTGENNGNS